MGDFSDFLALIGKLVKLILDITTYLIALVLLLLACVLPWRLWGIWCVFSNKSNGNDFNFRETCCCEFGKTAIDVVCVPAGLAAAIVPTRTVSYFADSLLLLRKDSDWNDKEQWSGDLRCFWIASLWHALWDIIFFAICAPSLVIPTRFYTFVRSIYLGRRQLRWEEYHVCPCSGSGDEDLRPWSCAGRLGTDMRMVWILSPIIGLLELCGFFSGLIAMCSLIRSIQTYRDVRKVMSSDDEFHELKAVLCFDAGLHKVLLLNGVSVAVDLIFIPVLLLLVLSPLRLCAALKALRQGLGWTTRKAILEQFVLLLVDLLLVVPFALVTLTWYRSRPVHQALGFRRAGAAIDVEQGAVRVRDRFSDCFGDCFGVLTEYHRALLRASGLLLLDLLLSPGLLLLAAVTCYRIPILVRSLPAVGTRYHGALLQQCWEMVLDTPFLLAGAIVVCTLYRADIVIGCARNARADRDFTAWDIRLAVGLQLLYLLRDMAMVPLLLITAAPLYRLPALLMGLKARMSRLLAHHPEMQPREVRLLAPRPKGRPGFSVRASKSPNLSRPKSLQIQVAGEGFWQAVADLKGGLAATAGRAMLPFGLKDGREVDFGVIAHGQSEAAINVEIQSTVKSETVEEFLRALPPQTDLLIQLEGQLESGRKVVFLAVPLTAAELLTSFSSPDSVISANCIRPSVIDEQDEAFNAEVDARIAALRGSSASGLRRDAWWPVVLGEFFQLVGDLVHLLLLVALFAMPWRLLLAIRHCFCEPADWRACRLASLTLNALKFWSEECDSIAAQLGPLTNSYAKEALGTTCTSSSSSFRRSGSDELGCERSVEECIGCFCCIFCPCCPNYVDFRDSDYYGDRSRRQHNVNKVRQQRLRALGSRLTLARAELHIARRRWPDEEDEDWAAIAKAIDAQISVRADIFFWLFFMPELHMLLAKQEVQPEEHTRAIQQVRHHVLRLEARCSEQGEALRARFGEKRGAATKKGRIKSKALCGSILREHFIKGFADLLAVPALALLVLTLYRLPSLRAQLQGRCDAARFKAVVRSHVLGLGSDLLVFLQVVLLVLVLTATLIKLPDFLSGLQPSRGLRAARMLAFMKVTELVVGILELLLLLTAWKTYRLIVQVTIFLLMSPGAMLAVAWPKECSRRIRFGISCVLSLLVLSSAFFLPWLVALVGWVLLLALAFVGLAAFNPGCGWIAPRRDDWWSPAVRLTLPNVMALSVICVESAVLLLAGIYLGGTSMSTAVQTHQITNLALGVICASIFVSTLPMVSDEEDRKDIVASGAWRGATLLLSDALFLPAVLSLACVTTQSPLHRFFFMYFGTTTLLGRGVWDVAVPYGALLDVRSAELNSSGRQLLLSLAVLAAADGREVLFLSMGAAACLWIAAWALLGGSSVLWADVLRVGGIAGALVAAMVDTKIAAIVWAAAVASAAVWAAVAGLRRRAVLAASGLPQALAELGRIREQMCLWGDAESKPMALDASVQGAALQVLGLEEQIPVERLRWRFLSSRPSWRQGLRDSHTFAQVLERLEELRVAIDAPCTRLLLKQLLGRAPLAGGRRRIPAPLVAQVAEFAVPRLQTELPSRKGDGWRSGKIDFEALQRDALTSAQRYSDVLQSKALGRPVVVGLPEVMRRCRSWV